MTSVRWLETWTKIIYSTEEEEVVEAPGRRPPFLWHQQGRPRFELSYTRYFLASWSVTSYLRLSELPVKYPQVNQVEYDYWQHKVTFGFEFVLNANLWKSNKIIQAFSKASVNAPSLALDDLHLNHELADIQGGVSSTQLIRVSMFRCFVWTLYWMVWMCPSRHTIWYSSNWIAPTPSPTPFFQSK